MGAGRHGSLREITTLMLAAATVGCGPTVDSVGYDNPSGIKLHPLSGPASYPNYLREAGKSDADITKKITAVFNQLFHGDTSSEAIYFPVGTDQAKIEDIFHGDARTEGMGYGMIIAVELDKQDEFNRLWRYATGVLEVTHGPKSGYFLSSCDAVDETEPCLDPFGMEQFVTALLFAHDRWGSASDIDYGHDALVLLDVMRHKQDQNHGVVDGVIDMFDPDAALPVDFPDATVAHQTQPSSEMPNYYQLWAQATGDPFWTRAAANARAHWGRTADPTTGLMPLRATFDGMPVAGSEMFRPESYRGHLSLVLDRIWFGRDPWEVDEANRLLAFFSAQGIDSYSASYTLSGQALNNRHDLALIAANGAAAAISTNGDRAAYIDRAWALSLTTGSGRYYSGTMDLLALLILSGQFRVL